MNIPVVFYFPWQEPSGGPIYLSSIASALSRKRREDIYYTDYEPGFSDGLLKGTSVKKITVSETNFSIPLTEPILLVTPIYWAHWLPKMHPESRIVFVNWHNLCLPVLKSSWGMPEEAIKKFLCITERTKSVFFCDEAHRLAQSRYGVEFDSSYVPIGIQLPKVVKQDYRGNENLLRLAVLGRLSIDKIFSITNLARHFDAFAFSGRKILYIIGDGPEKERVNARDYQTVEIVFVGSKFDKDLSDFLLTEADATFAMGTSALTCGSLGLPVVLVANEMEDYYSDAFVYLHDTVNYCLGWEVCQLAQLNVTVRSAEDVFAALADPESRARLGNAARRYVEEKHSVESSALLFGEAAERTTLTFKQAEETFLAWKPEQTVFRIGAIALVKRFDQVLQLRLGERGLVDLPLKISSR
jgi:glycosyltransferase involved in cell wall biosynthesis